MLILNLYKFSGVPAIFQNTSGSQFSEFLVATPSHCVLFYSHLEKRLPLSAIYVMRNKKKITWY